MFYDEDYNDYSIGEDGEFYYNSTAICDGEGLWEDFSDLDNEYYEYGE